MITIKMSTDFSRYPAGRFLTDGPFSGQKFREELLIPAIRTGEEITIELDDARRYGSSFLEEAFGGLTRGGFEPEKIIQQISFISKKDTSLPDEIRQFIRDGNLTNEQP